LEGTLPHFGDRSYTIRQDRGANEMSFNRKKWNPDTLYITAYLDGIDKGGIVCDYFNNFRLFACDGKIGMALPGGKVYESNHLPERSGQLVMRLIKDGSLEIKFNHKEAIRADL